MGTIVCHHCGKEFDDEVSHCPGCRTPAPRQQDSDLAAARKKFIIFIIGLLAFCVLMIYWLPRVIA